MGAPVLWADSGSCGARGSDGGPHRVPAPAEVARETQTPSAARGRRWQPRCRSESEQRGGRAWRMGTVAPSVQDTLASGTRFLKKRYYPSISTKTFAFCTILGQSSSLMEFQCGPSLPWP